MRSACPASIIPVSIAKSRQSGVRMRVLAMLLSAALVAPALLAQKTVWQQHIRSGKVQLDRGSYHEAEESFLAAVGAAKQLGDGPKAIGLRFLAIVQYQLGQYVEAQRACRESLRFAEQAFGHDDPFVGKLMLQLGMLYSETGRYSRAERVFRRVLEIEERRQHPDQDNTFSALGNLAYVAMARHLYAEAMRLQQEALSLGETVLGPDHPEVAHLLSSLSAIQWAGGRNPEGFVSRICG